ncbi:Tim44 domain-containing protein [Rhodocyclus tenuis]|uniref:Tim44 domain-containing protein n=1 Tax=Rhodocyclus gracilis TaxID=2929842 RepID=A0ABX0WF15_9RHOO|nr:TIM44-like domain-containing protein [Rhodocyclus gracilis]NJA88318.1 Tim44 domain-containing protein [Rhodocyclus gracilis]
MRKTLFALFLAVMSLALTVGEAEAKRLGGGKSVGMQREAVTQRAPTPEPTRNAVAPTPAPTPVGAAAAAPKRNWLGPIAGLAAGLGLAALASHFGFGEELANALMIALLVFAAFALFRFFTRRKDAPAAASPLQYAGAGAANNVPPPVAQRETQAPVIGSALGATPPANESPAHVAPNIPADFDVEGFLRVAKLNFVRLQAANDSGNVADLREFLSPEVFAEIKLQIDERGAVSQQTDIVTLEVALLEVVTEGDRHIASVRFTGMVREEADANAEPFNEVWHLTKPVAGDRGWTVAGLQQIA